jgi:hypothetical protein
MSEKNGGFVHVHKDKLLYICQECLEHIQARRNAIENSTAYKFMVGYNNRAVRWNRIPLLGKKFPLMLLKDVEETKKYMDLKYRESNENDSDGIGDRAYEYRSIYAWGTLKQIEHLVSCCASKDTEDIIEVDIDLFHQLVVR